MLFDLLLFFFVLLGSKILMGAVAIWMLIPRDTTCSICDAETLPLEHPRGSARVLRLLRLQRRWCMECRSESFGRRVPLPRVDHEAPLPVAEPRLR